VSDRLDKAKEFLSAPKEVTSSESELRKLYQRKAQEEARVAREAALKSTEDPSLEDLVADIIRVAEDEEANPFAKFRSVSQRRYELYGHYHVRHVFEQFGTFHRAKQVAGLEETEGTRVKKRARAEQDRREHAARYAEECIWPHVAKREDTALRESKIMLSISDTHSTFLCPFTWHCFLRAIEHVEPDIVFLNGDILEGAEISSHVKIPGWTVPLQLEFDFARAMFEKVREVAPDADVYWGAGNHGLDRIARYLSTQAPALASLRSMRFDELAGVDDLGVMLVQGGSIASPAEQEDSLPGLVLHGSYTVTHGTSVAKNAASVELDSAGMSGQSGHTHRPAVAFATTERGGPMSWMSTPMGCTDRAGKAYIKRRNTGWQSGFGFAALHPGGGVQQYPVITSHGRCFVEGMEITREDWSEPPVKLNWLAG